MVGVKVAARSLGMVTSIGPQVSIHAFGVGLVSVVGVAGDGFGFPIPTDVAWVGVNLKLPNP